MIENTNAIRKYQPHKLYSLIDMIQFIGADFLGVMRSLRREIAQLDGQPHESIATAEERKRLDDLLEGDVGRLCYQLDLKISEDRCCALVNKVLEQQLIPELPRHEIKTDLDGLLDSIYREMAYTLFAHIPESKAEFFEQGSLFGEEFHKNASKSVF